MQKGIASLQELESWYSIDDILERCDGLDSIDRAHAKHAARQKEQQ